MGKNKNVNTLTGKNEKVNPTLTGKNEKVKYTKNNCMKLKSGDSISCNDDVLVNRVGNELWVAKVKGFNRNKARISWYYMPEDTKLGRLPFQGANEILYSNHIDNVSIDAIVRKCNVYEEKTYKTFEVVDADTYLCRSGYDQTNGRFTEDTKFTVYCTCRLPYNPDSEMIRCGTCNSWFHPFCVGIKTKAELKKMKTKIFECKHATPA